MSRALSSTITSAIAADATAPVYLVQMAFDTPRRVATWDADVTWGGFTWSASGIKVSGLSSSGTRLTLPTGESDPWLSLVLTDGTRGRAISIYEHHTDTTASPQTDAVLIFTGIMDEFTITDKVTINVIDTSRAKAFPAESVDESTFTHLLNSGDTITWGNKTITVN